ncbi:hypothetical protein PRIPAC_86566 [Pristionchus pacificus]|uniref:CUB domain-containing protein n=1 Tax=Pristionchus pacificus TaxID=54126 RepID=A0A2A6CE06_PRIPA|nr:hypothetical protein PRIPAC_86566 [Pristionchus pacificus]|eukprot:PDM76475.1 CUB domain-containing protein [Pristionchus pacificus]
MKLIILFAVASLIWACPPDYRLLARGRCFKTLQNRTKDTPANLLKQALTDCGKDGAYPPIIFSEEDNDMFNAVASTVETPEGAAPAKLLLGLVCNQKSRRLEWADDSKVDYRKNGLSVDFDCTKDETVVSEPSKNDWLVVSTTRTDYTYTIMCTTQPPEIPDDPCGDYDRMPDPTGYESVFTPCYKLHLESKSWNAAQSVCNDEKAALARIETDEENSYLWRTAVQSSAVNGVHIGLYQDAAQNWIWVDDDSDAYYDPYVVSGFPIRMSPPGKCGALQTENSKKQWINIDCDNEPLPFFCRRNETAESNVCNTDDLEQEKEIIAPGFPHPNISCEYSLSVSIGQIVELQIDFFEANECCDSLEILEGPIGPHPIATLTGTDLETTVYHTTSSNVMRVNWKPNGAINVRGFKMRYRGIGGTSVASLQPVEATTTEEVTESTSASEASMEHTTSPRIRTTEFVETSTTAITETSTMPSTSTTEEASTLAHSSSLQLRPRRNRLP